jgi:hypothetical protein
MQCSLRPLPILGGLLCVSLVACPIPTFAVGPVAPAEASRPHPGPNESVQLVLQFNDDLYSHTMGITSDRQYYYTINGGVASRGRINTFDLSGNIVNTTSAFLDARAILWSAHTGAFYVKDSSYNIYQVNPRTGAASYMGTWFQWQQSSPAIGPDGRAFVEHQNGNCRVIGVDRGILIHQGTGFRYGAFPSSEAICMDGYSHVLTWNGDTVFVQDKNANLLQTMVIPYGHYGYTLDWANGLLFTADDQNYGSNGTWYGYAISPVGQFGIRFAQRPVVVGGRLSYAVEVWNQKGRGGTATVWADLVGPTGTEIHGPERQVTLDPNGSAVVQDAILLPNGGGDYELLVSVGTSREGVIYNTIFDDVVVGDAPPKFKTDFGLTAASSATGAHVSFSVPRETTVDVRVYDIAGREVSRIASGRFQQGTHAADWFAHDSAGRPLASGVYFVRLAAGAETRAARVVRVAP